MAQWFIFFLTYWILYSYLVPISLFVTMELVKFWQARCHTSRYFPFAFIVAPHTSSLEAPRAQKYLLLKSASEP